MAFSEVSFSAKQCVLKMAHGTAGSLLYNQLPSLLFHILFMAVLLTVRFILIRIKIKEIYVQIIKKIETMFPVVI